MYIKYEYILYNTKKKKRRKSRIYKTNFTHLCVTGEMESNEKQNKKRRVINAVTEVKLFVPQRA